jgi:iron complex transport system substrate-binding protein
MVVTAALAAIGLVLGACAGNTPDKPASTPSASGAFPLTAGSATLNQRPGKIVVLAPTATEMLFAIGAGAQVVAADSNSDYPPEAPKTDLSGFQPNAEAIAAKNPDLVIISNDIGKISDQLGQLKIPVYLAEAARTLDDTYAQLHDLGKLTGHVTEAADVAQRMRADIGKLVKDVPQRAKKLSYYYELDQTLYSVTSKTFIGSLFGQIGLANLADAADADGAKGGYPQLSAEFLVQANPDLIFLADTKCCNQSAETVTARPGWAGITAVKNKQIVVLDDDIASRWGPRVVELLRTVVEAVGKVAA